MDDIIPFAVKGLRHETDGGEFVIVHPSSCGILAPVQPAGDRESLRRSRAGDQPDDGLVVPQRLPAPVRRDEREQPVFHFVPFARARRKMADPNRQPRSVGQLLQLKLPQPQPISVAPAAVGGDQQLPGPGVQASALRSPPPLDRGHREGARVMVGSHIHKPAVASQIVDAVGIRARHRRTGKIMALDVLRRLLRKPLAALVLEIPDQFLLLRVDGNDRLGPAQGRRDLFIDVSELGRVPKLVEIGWKKNRRFPILKPWIWQS